jgi:hypothetical protein
MYTSYIGKKFLKLYNEREGKNLSAEEFFEKEFFPLFFNNDRHLLHVGNSPFFQKPKDEDVKQYGNKSLAQYNNLKNAMETDVPNMSIFVGSAAKGLEGTTSGQVSINPIIDKNEMYSSWMGEALGIGVSGGLVMLIDEPEILWILFTGWKYYRAYLAQTPNVKDKQIETWNGQWLWRFVQSGFDENHPLDNFTIETTEVQGNIAIPTQEWIKIIFALAKKFPNKIITAYSYNLSQTNTTLGFINLYLPEVRKLYELRDKVIIDESKTILSEEEINTFSTFYTFKNACKFGTIGLKAIEPAKLREYMPKGSVIYAQGKDYKFSDEQSYINYKLFKIWIIAMLNKTELLNLASDIAKALLEFEKMEERGKKVYATLSQEVRDAKNLQLFVGKLTEVLERTPENAEVFKKVVKEGLQMSSDNYPLFITLIRFEYTYLKSKDQ